MTAPQDTAARILVVDDAATVRLYHRGLLNEAGWDVDEACNGLEALERVQCAERPYALYVVDVNMPRMDGFRFVRELRALDAAHQAPVLMVSTEAQPQDERMAREAGANAYLVKPARPQALVLTAALLLGDRERALRAVTETTR